MTLQDQLSEFQRLNKTLQNKIDKQAKELKQTNSEFDDLERKWRTLINLVRAELDNLQDKDEIRNV